MFLHEFFNIFIGSRFNFYRKSLVIFYSGSRRELEIPLKLTT